jgi:hypothetical protein
MTCYICANPAENSIRVHDSVTFPYCDAPRNSVILGISNFVLTGTLDRIEGFKEEYMTKYKGSAYREFEKCKRIGEMYENYDSSVTEQPL